MTNRTEAQKAADARYDAKRRGPSVAIRLTEGQRQWLDHQRVGSESRVAAITRLLGIDQL